MPHDGPMIIYVVTTKHLVEQILIVNESSINLIYWNYFEKKNISCDKLKTESFPLYSFTRKFVPMTRLVQLAAT